MPDPDLREEVIPIKNIYLDHAAATPLSQETKEYLISLLDTYGNPSSLHSLGGQARQLLSSARESAARFINARPDRICFTGSGSASNTLAIKGCSAEYNCRILYSPTAHKSILNCAKDCPHSHPLTVDRQGAIILSDLEKLLDAGDTPALAVIDYASSELGTIQDVQTIIDLVHSRRGLVFLDCTGSIPTIPVDVNTLDADMLAFSAHKLGALKGCGVLYKKPGVKLKPLVYGSQEQGLWGGTENILGIASLGTALRQYDYASVSPRNRDYVYDYVRHNIPDSYLVGSPVRRLPHNLYLCFRGVDGESLMILLDLKGIQVSTGSACNSQSRTASAALSAIGMDEADIHSCIRLSFSGRETTDELDYVCRTLKEAVDRLRDP